jgi:hypothetical protein
MIENGNVDNGKVLEKNLRVAGIKADQHVLMLTRNGKGTREYKIGIFERFNNDRTHFTMRHGRLLLPQEPKHGILHPNYDDKVKVPRKQPIVSDGFYVGLENAADELIQREGYQVYGGVIYATLRDIEMREATEGIIRMPWSNNGGGGVNGNIGNGKSDTTRYKSTPAGRPYPVRKNSAEQSS